MNKSFQVTVTATSSRNVEVSWTKPTILSWYPYEMQYKVTVKDLKNGKITSTHKIEERSIKWPCRLLPGHEYLFQVLAYDTPQGASCAVARVTHRSTLVPWEMITLHTRALDFVKGEKHSEISVVYRNKPHSYFKDILQNRGGIMEVYDKDLSGDPGSPINGQLDGLFFSTTVWGNKGLLPHTSPFGDLRLLMPAKSFTTTENNLYFTDFYCHKGKHLVTLVVTKKGSQADKFCSTRLIKLSFNANPFFYKDLHTNRHYCSKKVTVEVFYTENVNFKEKLSNPRCLQRVRTTGRGSSVPDSKPKNPSCTVCNLYPEYG